MVAAQVRGTRQRADKRGKVPRELPDLVLPPDGICTRRIISHDLSLPVHARHGCGPKKVTAQVRPARSQTEAGVRAVIDAGPR